MLPSYDAEHTASAASGMLAMHATWKNTVQLCPFAPSLVVIVLKWDL
jgi:hypothetical protein